MRDIGLKIFGFNLDAFLNCGFSFATLLDDSEIERFIRSEIGLDKTLAPYLRKMPCKLSMQAALLASTFYPTYSPAYFHYIVFHMILPRLPPYLDADFVCTSRALD